MDTCCTPSGVPMPTRLSDREDSGVVAEPGVLVSEGSPWASLSPRSCQSGGDSGVAAKPGVLLAGKRPFGRRYPIPSCQTGETRV